MFQWTTSTRDPSMSMESGDELKAHHEASNSAVLAPLVTGKPRGIGESTCTNFLCQWMTRFNNDRAPYRKVNLRSTRP